MKPCRMIFVFMIAGYNLAYTQSKKPDSLYIKLSNASNDSSLYAAQNLLTDFYIETDRDSALFFASHCIEVASKNNKLLDEAAALSNKGHALMHLDRLSEAFTSFTNAIEIATNVSNNKKTWQPGQQTTADKERLHVLAKIYFDFSNLMVYAGNFDKGQEYLLAAKKTADENNDDAMRGAIYLELGHNYLNQKKDDSAMAMERKATTLLTATNQLRSLGYNHMVIALIWQQKHQNDSALYYFHKAIAISSFHENFTNLRFSYSFVTQFYLEKVVNLDSALFYTRKNLEIAKVTNIDNGTVYADLIKIFTLKNQKDSVLKYQSILLIEKDKTFVKRIATLQDLQKSSLQEQEKIKLLEAKAIENKNRLRITVGFILLLAISVISVILYRSNRKKQKANASLQKALGDLKSTQSQLIQSEKMASLGELTAGIAHEIQNPLNFVNNFSEVNTELIDELQAERNKEEDKRNSQLENDLINDIKQNLEKINLHGKRADAIVKGMLQHSRSSSGHTEPTDINALCDEYLRLSFHGMKAKDKSFNAIIKTDFDNTIGKINIVPQDIGRVLLNLYNNAFYAVSPQPPVRTGTGGAKEEVLITNEVSDPTIWVSTKKDGNNILITVRDNGTGIPGNVVDKIFQPFFTTKPTGQGTGLGLSMAYDIVKAHGGELKVETKEGEGSVFIIQLPVI